MLSNVRMFRYVVLFAVPFFLLSFLIVACTPITPEPAAESSVVSAERSVVSAHSILEGSTIGTPTFNDGSEVASIIENAYGKSPEELAADARIRGRDIYESTTITNGPLSHEPLWNACDDPVYATRQITYADGSGGNPVYASLPGAYNWPVLWTLSLNFTERDIVDDYQVYLGCFMPWYRLEKPDYGPLTTTLASDTPGPVDAAYFPTLKGHPVFCFPVGENGVNELPDEVIDLVPNYHAVDGRVYTRTVAHAPFAGDTFLWCPIDMAESLREFETTGEGNLKDEVFMHLRGFYDTSENSEPLALEDSVRRIEEYLHEVIDTKSADFDNLISVAGIKDLGATTTSSATDVTHPLMAYVPACEGTCYAGYESGAMSAGGPAAMFDLYQRVLNNDGVTLNFRPGGQTIDCLAQYGTGDALKWGYWEYTQEVCSMAFPSPTVTSSLYAITDMGTVTGTTTWTATHGGMTTTSITARDAKSLCQPGGVEAFARLRALDFNASPPTPTPQVCSGDNVASSTGLLKEIPLWMGPAHFLIGRGWEENSPIFNGVLEFIWFDPDQGSGT